MKFMKRAGGFLLGLLLAAVFTGCGSSPDEDFRQGLQDAELQISSGRPKMQENDSADSTQATAELEEGQISVEEEILGVYQKMQDAMVNKDTDYLRSVMGSEVHHISGQTQTIDEWLQDVENENMKYYRIDVTDPVITIHGDTAVLSCTNVIEARIYGSYGTWSLSGGAYFEKIDGEWVQSVPE